MRIFLSLLLLQNPNISLCQNYFRNSRRFEQKIHRIWNFHWSYWSEQKLRKIWQNNRRDKKLFGEPVLCILESKSYICSEWKNLKLKQIEYFRFKPEVSEQQTGGASKKITYFLIMTCVEFMPFDFTFPWFLRNCTRFVSDAIASAVIWIIWKCAAISNIIGGTLWCEYWFRAMFLTIHLKLPNSYF